MSPDEIHIAEPQHTPALELLLGCGAMLPFAAGALAALRLAADGAVRAIDLTILWGAAILLFLAGVRRGLAFRTPGGPTFAQLATSLGLFALGLLALAVPWPTAALALLLAGYLALAVLDPWAARRGEAPPYFARLRPPQLLIPLVSLASVLARQLLRT